MVAQTKTDVRSAPAKAAAGKSDQHEQVIVDNKGLLDDQVAAAAVVDADQSDAVAAQVAAEGGMLPTDAPIHSIGEMAQAPAPTTTDTTTAAPTAAPEATAADTAPLSPWAIGGIALLGVGAVAAAASGGSDSSPAPTPEPIPEPPPPPPPPPANVAPTSSDPAAILTDIDGHTALSATSFPFADSDVGDVLTSVKIGAITATPITNVMGEALQYDAATGHGYELVSGPITWAEANAAAIAKGGHLAILDTEAEMAWVNTQYVLGTDSGVDGTWVGASQAADSANEAAGWTWLNGSPLDASAASLLWNNQGVNDEPNDSGSGAENNFENYAAVFDGTGPSDTHLLYDAGDAVSGFRTDIQAAYLIEYDTANAPLTLNGAPVEAGTTIAAADLGNLSWNSVFNTGGTVAFTVGDNDGAYSTPENTLTFTNVVTIDSGAGQALSTLIEDQHLTVLA